jgi:hypothetical protein
MPKIFWIFLSLMLLSFQCEDELDDPIASQDIVFAKIYVNHAWGDSLDGWFIDNAGYVKGFSNQRNPEIDWKEMLDGGFISKSDLLYNYSQCDTLYTQIPLAELFEYYEKIDAASKGSLTEGANQGADMGQISYYCLRYDPLKAQYRFILLNSYGDWKIENTSPEANKIYNWLTTINKDQAEPV